jgi:hypothetical protein
VEKLKNGQAIERGYLGVRIQPINDDLAASLGLPKNRGEFIQSVEPGAGAAKAGIQAGDVVTRVDGKEVKPDQTLSFIVANTPPGKTVAIDLVRNGKPMTVNAVVGKRPSEEDLANQSFSIRTSRTMAASATTTAMATSNSSRSSPRLVADPEVAGHWRRAADPDHCPSAWCERRHARRGRHRWTARPMPVPGPPAPRHHPLGQLPHAQHPGRSGSRGAPGQGGEPRSRRCAQRAGQPAIYLPIRLR